MGGAVIGGALGLAGAAMSSSSAKDAAKAQTKAADAAAQAQLDMYYQSRTDLAPWREAGAGAINALWGTPGTPAQTIQGAPIYGSTTPEIVPGQNITMPIYGSGYGGEVYQNVPGEPWSGAGGGINTPYMQGNQIVFPTNYGVTAAPTQQQIVGYEPSTTIPATEGTQGLIQKGPGEFKESPSYQFVLGEGLKGMQRGASATGRLGSGAYLKDATRYAEGLASTEYDNFLRRYYESLNPYFSLAGMGQVSSGQSASGATSAGNTLANIALMKGQSQAAGNLGQMYPWSQLANYGAGQLGQYAVNQQAMNALNKYQPAPLNQWWGQTQYTPSQVNSMGWL